MRTRSVRHATNHTRPGVTLADVADDRWDRIRLAEFDALRRESDRRSTSQQALIAINLTAIAAVVGLVASGRAQENVLLVLPIVSSVLGILVLDHAIQIRRIGAYIEMLWTWQPSWQSYIREHPPPRWMAGVYWASMLLIFAVGPVAALVIAFPFGDNRASVWFAWAGGAVLTALYVGAYLKAKPWTRRPLGFPPEEPVERPRSPA